MVAEPDVNMMELEAAQDMRNGWRQRKKDGRNGFRGRISRIR
jgi:hypothetical protein